MEKQTIIIASDAHGYIWGLDLIVENEPKADYYLDLGDNFCGMEPTEQFYQQWISVRGNNDGPFAPYRRDFKVFDKTIRMLHGDRLLWDYSTSDELYNYMDNEGIDILLFGHTHQRLYHQQCDQDGKITKILLNPGSIGEPRDYDLMKESLGSYCVLTIYSDGRVKHTFKTQPIY